MQQLVDSAAEDVEQIRCDGLTRFWSFCSAPSTVSIWILLPAPIFLFYVITFYLCLLSHGTTGIWGAYHDKCGGLWRARITMWGCRDALTSSLSNLSGRHARQQTMVSTSREFREDFFSLSSGWRDQVIYGTRTLKIAKEVEIIGRRWSCKYQPSQ